MPWLANTFWQLLLSLVLFCCKHCRTAPSSPNCFRHKRCASRLQACCSWGVPMWPCANDNEVSANKITRASTDERITVSFLDGGLNAAPRLRFLVLPLRSARCILSSLILSIRSLGQQGPSRGGGTLFSLNSAAAGMIRRSKCKGTGTPVPYAGPFLAYSKARRRRQWNIRPSSPFSETSFTSPEATYEKSYSYCTSKHRSYR